MKENIVTWLLVILVIVSLISAGHIITRPREKTTPLMFSTGIDTSTTLPALLKSQKRGNGVGIVEVFGPIYFEDTSQAFPHFIQRGSATIVDRIDKLLENDQVKAILLRINSPGGTIGAVEEIDRALQRARERDIPLVASMADVAASGGYYVAASCDKIFANAGTLTGSIGVIFSVLNAAELMDKIGLGAEVIKSGSFKDIGSWTRDMTEEERGLLDETVQVVYRQFLEHVAQGRNVDAEAIEPWADGRIMSGSQAVQAGLVDKIGDMDAAFSAAAELGGLDPDKARKIYPAQVSGNLFLQLLQAMQQNIPGLGGGTGLRMRGPRLMYMTPGWELY